MIRLNVWETNSSEGEIFLRLVGRGRHADIPYYFSVASWNVEKGWVIFERLDCGERQPFRVGVAGNSIIFQDDRESEVASWLNTWGLEVIKKECLTLDSPEVAHTVLFERRKAVMPEADRKRMNTEFSRKFLEHLREEDAGLLRQCR